MALHGYSRAYQAATAHKKMFDDVRERWVQQLKNWAADLGIAEHGITW
jgi:hypothetical protein